MMSPASKPLMSLSRLVPRLVEVMGVSKRGQGAAGSVGVSKVTGAAGSGEKSTPLVRLVATMPLRISSKGSVNCN